MSKWLKWVCLMTTLSLSDDRISRIVAHNYNVKQGLDEAERDVISSALHDLIVNDTMSPESYFVSLIQQLVNIERWNDSLKWGFTAEQISRMALEAHTFTLPQDSLQAVVLVPSLASPAATAEGLIYAAKIAGGLRHWPADLVDLMEIDSNMWLIDGLDFKPNSLEWRLVDLGSFMQPLRRGKSGVKRYDDRAVLETPAHAEVLAAAAHFPKWLEAVRSRSAPSVILSGYRMTNPVGKDKLPVALSLSYVLGAHAASLYPAATDVIWEGYSIATAGSAQ